MQTLALILLFSCGKKAQDNPEEKPLIDRPSAKREIIDENSKLHLRNAIIANDMVMLESALENIQNLNFHFVDGQTPLTKAIKFADNDVIMSLLKYEVDINLTAQDGSSPINLVIKKKNKKILYRLLELGVKLNAIDNSGMTPLVNTIFFYNETEAINLVKHGANVTGIDQRSGISIEELANLFGFLKLHKLIVNIKSHEKIDEKYMRKAISAGDTTFVDYLLLRHPEYVAIINEKNMLLDVLKVSVSEIDSENAAIRWFMLNDMLAAGANGHNENGQSPLHYTIENDMFNEMDRLLRYGAQIEHENEDGLNALTLAASTKKLKFTQELYRILQNKLKNSTPSEFEILSQEFDQLLEKACLLVPKPSRMLFSRTDPDLKEIRELLKCR